MLSVPEYDLRVTVLKYTFISKLKGKCIKSKEAM